MVPNYLEATGVIGADEDEEDELDPISAWGFIAITLAFFPGVEQTSSSLSPKMSGLDDGPAALGTCGVSYPL